MAWEKKTNTGHGIQHFDLKTVLGLCCGNAASVRGWYGAILCLRGVRGSFYLLSALWAALKGEGPAKLKAAAVDQGQSSQMAERPGCDGAATCYMLTLRPKLYSWSGAQASANGTPGTDQAWPTSTHHVELPVRVGGGGAWGSLVNIKLLFWLTERKGERKRKREILLGREHTCGAICCSRGLFVLTTLE